MVTSANDAKTVNDAARLGAVDYLVKPFAYERFRQALDVFCRRRESVQRDNFSQEALDHTLFQAAAPTPPVTPPKGLQSQTLSRIEAYRGLRRIHGIPVMRSHRMLACQLSLCAGI